MNPDSPQESNREARRKTILLPEISNDLHISITGQLPYYLSVNNSQMILNNFFRGDVFMLADPLLAGSLTRG
jgi:hypothetical protein